jgi:predicted O-methyltransferase YrrM
MVYPHNDEIQKNHGNIEVYHKDYKDHLDTSLEDNIKLLREKMDELGIEKFDLAFIDGDHEYQSFFRDLQTAKALVKEDGWLIIDDIEDPNHQQIVAYQELKDQTKFYEYEDWNPKPGIALIKNRDFIL